MSGLQCKITGLHASHVQYCFIDPTHLGGHFSVDVKHIFLKQNKSLNEAPTDLCLTDLDRILAEEQDPGAHHYLVLGTVPIKE